MDLFTIQDCGKIVENDNYSFEKIEPEGVFDVAFELRASLPKLELPKHKVLIKKD